MANPSTQPPAGSTSCDIIFSQDFVQSTFTLLELPKVLEDYLEKHAGEDALSFQVRGLETDTAVLCTPTQTFILQRAHTSNTLLPIAPAVHSVDPESAMDLDVDLDSDEKKQVVLDILDSVLDLLPISPRLDRLGMLLGQSMYDGLKQEANIKGHLYTWSQLQSVVQASDKEILTWLQEHHARVINGHWRLFKRRFMYDILQDILMSLNVLDLKADSVVEGATVWGLIGNGQPMDTEEAPDEGDDADKGPLRYWMIEHCLDSFSGKEKVLPKGYFHLSEEKVCKYLGVHLLSAHDRGSRWRLEDFMKVWQESVHEHFLVDLAFLAGECIIEADRSLDRNQSNNYIRYFSKDHLPNDPALRFSALFEIKSKWEAKEIRPFLRDLVVDEKKLDVLLLKHARSVKQPGGGVVYNSRVIK